MKTQIEVKDMIVEVLASVGFSQNQLHTILCSSNTNTNKGCAHALENARTYLKSAADKLERIHLN